MRILHCLFYQRCIPGSIAFPAFCCQCVAFLRRISEALLPKKYVLYSFGFLVIMLL